MDCSCLSWDTDTILISNNLVLVDCSAVWCSLAPFWIGNTMIGCWDPYGEWRKKRPEGCIKEGLSEMRAPFYSPHMEGRCRVLVWVLETWEAGPNLCMWIEQMVVREGGRGGGGRQGRQQTTTFTVDMSEVARTRRGPQRMTAVGAYSCVTEAKQRWPFLVQSELERAAGGLLVLFSWVSCSAFLPESPPFWSLILTIEANPLSLSGHLMFVRLANL